MSDKINSVDSFIKLVTAYRAAQIRAEKNPHQQKDLRDAKRLAPLIDVWIERHEREERQLQLFKGRIMAKCRVCKEREGEYRRVSDGLLVCPQCYRDIVSMPPTRDAQLRIGADDAGQKSPMCNPIEHDWNEEYYGYKCLRCQMFYPYGSAPWETVDE